MPDPLRSPWTRLALVGIFLALLALGLCLGSRWLTQAGFILLFAFMLAAIGYEWQQRQRREEVRENLRRILEERGRKRLGPLTLDYTRLHPQTGVSRGSWCRAICEKHWNY